MMYLVINTEGLLMQMNPRILPILQVSNWTKTVKQKPFTNQQPTPVYTQFNYGKVHEQFLQLYNVAK